MANKPPVPCLRQKLTHLASKPITCIRVTTDENDKLFATGLPPASRLLYMPAV